MMNSLLSELLVVLMVIGWTTEGVSEQAREKLIEENSTDMNEMVWAAKYGKWNKALSIVKHNPFLINCIPEHRAWALLHQAAWWGNEMAVKILLSIPNCDPLVHSKKTLAGEPAQMTPSQVADQRGYSNIGKILKDKERNMKIKFASSPPTFISVIEGEKMDKEGLPLLLYALATHKKTFYPNTINLSQDFVDVLRDIFNYEHEGNHWSHARDTIAMSLDAICRSTDILFQNASSEDDFYEKIVYFYTTETKQCVTNYSVYSTMNRALAREAVPNYHPYGFELSLGPYCLMLDAVLFHWSKLSTYSGTTYRGTKLGGDRKKYEKIGTKFVWPFFVSSSTEESTALSFAKDVLFVIDNSTAQRWRPRLIENYSQFNESEALYPAGAEFEVTKVSGIRIYLKLIDPA